MGVREAESHTDFRRRQIRGERESFGSPQLYRARAAARERAAARRARETSEARAERLRVERQRAAARRRQQAPTAQQRAANREREAARRRQQTQQATEARLRVERQRAAATRRQQAPTAQQRAANREREAARRRQQTQQATEASSLSLQERNKNMHEQEVERGSLREAAAVCSSKEGKNVHVGAAIMPDYLNAHYDPYSSVLNREFNSVVVEHHMKWKPLLVGGDEGVYDFRPCDKIVDWASDKGMAVKGHTLCWHVTTPEFAEEMSASRLREALYRHIRTTMGHFYGRVESWDVVNEALRADCSGEMEDNVYLRKLGPGYVDDCFRVAHQIDPNAKLIYNDNKVEGAGLPDGRSVKADAMYDLLKGMKERGVPVHGAGLQAHFDAAGTGLRRTPTPHSVRRQVRRLGELGLSVNISEMDVRVAGLPEGVDAQKAQSDIYGDVLGACLPEEAFDGFTLWGFSDRYSWVHNFYQPDSPLPWDKDFKPKRVVGALRGALLQAPRANKGENGPTLAAEILATPEHLWGEEWMMPEPGKETGAGSGDVGGGSGGGGRGAVDQPNWNASNHV